MEHLILEVEGIVVTWVPFQRQVLAPVTVVVMTCDLCNQVFGELARSTIGRYMVRFSRVDTVLADESQRHQAKGGYALPVTPFTWLASATRTSTSTPIPKATP